MHLNKLFINEQLAVVSIDIEVETSSIRKVEQNGAVATIHVDLAEVLACVTHFKRWTVLHLHIKPVADFVDAERGEARATAQVTHSTEGYVAVLAVHRQILHRAHVDVGVVLSEIGQDASVEAQLGVRSIDASSAGKRHRRLAVAGAQEVLWTIMPTRTERAILTASLS